MFTLHVYKVTFRRDGQPHAMRIDTQIVTTTTESKARRAVRACWDDISDVRATKIHTLNLYDHLS